MFKVNKERCVGCGACLQTCPDSTKIGDDGKAEVIDQNKIKECGKENACPLGAIEEIADQKN